MPVKFPCISCNCPVKVNQHGIFCDSCQNWIHLKCTSLSSSDYDQPSASDQPWYCMNVYEIIILPFSTLDSVEFQQLFYEPILNHDITTKPSLNDLPKFKSLNSLDPDNPAPFINMSVPH